MSDSTVPRAVVAEFAALPRAQQLVVVEALRSKVVRNRQAARARSKGDPIRGLAVAKVMVGAFEAGQRYGADPIPEVATIALSEWAAGKKVEIWIRHHDAGHGGEGYDPRCPLCAPEPGAA